ncbi:hypothetical protein V5799_017978 [Amblyomma americanum]|uniref:Secreted protein n=1 Tax=Amblyomma americanum TaxID=6943 RepID=A0AAQ4F1P0_AMBAM
MYIRRKNRSQSNMAFVKLLAAAVLMALAVAAGAFSTRGGKCDTPDIDLDGEVDKLLEKLPKAHPLGIRQGFSSVFAGLEIGDVTVTGMNKIERSGPVVPYCKNGSSIVQADLINPAAVQFTMPWKTCGGQKGNIHLSADLSRFTLDLSVANEESSGKYLSMGDDFSPVPVMTYNVNFVVEGLGRPGNIASGVLSKLFPSVFLEVWMQAFFWSLRGVLDSALQQNNEVF